MRPKQIVRAVAGNGEEADRLVMWVAGMEPRIAQASRPSEKEKADAKDSARSSAMSDIRRRRRQRSTETLNGGPDSRASLPSVLSLKSVE